MEICVKTIVWNIYNATATNTWMNGGNCFDNEMIRSNMFLLLLLLLLLLLFWSLFSYSFTIREFKDDEEEDGVDGEENDVDCVNDSGDKNQEDVVDKRPSA